MRRLSSQALVLSLALPLVLATVTMSASAGEAPPDPPAGLEVVDAYPKLRFRLPVEIQTAPGDEQYLYVATQPGIVWRFLDDPDTFLRTAFLDLSGIVRPSGVEFGLLGLAFHPDYATNGYFYVLYQVESPTRNVLARYQVSADPAFADAASELILLEVVLPEPDTHNVHRVVFGPDGYLYVGAGDGGCCGDPYDSSQDTSELLGSILRIDVDDPPMGQTYGIPPDNPFAGTLGTEREEIYAWGLRNPWNFTFDPDGRMWAGDVGQDAWEEVDLIEKGNNYGWPITEGFECYDPPTGCDTTGLTPPVWTYPHTTAGGFSITVGEVYRGTACADLHGRLLYADFVTGNVWALAYDETGTATDNDLVATSHRITNFGFDTDGTLLFTDHGDRFSESGRILRFECDQPLFADGFESGGFQAWGGVVP